MSAIKKINLGETCFPIQEQTIFYSSIDSNGMMKQFNLSRREMELLGYIKNYYTNQQMAIELHLSIYTIETHRKKILQKLKLETPVALMKFIISNYI